MDLTDEQKENLQIDLKRKRDSQPLIRCTKSMLQLAIEAHMGKIKRMNKKKGGEIETLEQYSANLNSKTGINLYAKKDC